MTSGCAPPWARLGVRAIRWEIRQLRFEGATIAGLARQLATTWNTVWSHIKPHLMTLPVLRGFGCWGLMRGVWHHQDRRRRGPRELTGIVDHSREGSPHGAGPLPGTARTPSTINSKTPPASSMPSISSSSLATLQVRYAARVQQDTTGHRARTGDPLYPGPQSFARLAPQAHPTLKGTIP